MLPLSDRNPEVVTGHFAAHLDCVPCLVRQAHEAVLAATTDPPLRERVLRQVLKCMARMNWNESPPALGQRIHRLIREQTLNPDPYARIKRQLNQRAEHLYPVWHRRFRHRFSPLEASVRMAIAGNLLDVGAKTELSDAGVQAAFEDALTAPLRGSVDALDRAIWNARDILYLADNAGEIVFDRDLLALLPLGKFTVIVRGSPVLNDATLADAESARLADFCELETNGSDAPGTLLEQCAPAFRARFESADLIIAKGQGNYESLAGVSQHIFFLLKVKCPVIAKSLQYPIGSLVLHHQEPRRPAHPAPANAVPLAKPTGWREPELP